MFYRNQRYDLTESFLTALIKECQFYGNELKGHPIHTIFFGGGTPNSVPVSFYIRLFPVLRNAFSLTDDCEISMEMNPEFIQKDYLDVLKRFGLNRVSIGFQSLNTPELNFLGRTHSTDDSINALQIVKQTDISNINLDFIINTPLSQSETLIKQLKTVVSLNPTHLSTYSLSVEKGSQFYRDNIQIPSEEASSDLYMEVRQYLMRNGFDHYEVSAFSKPGFQCRHNLSYWTLSPYIGLGPSAVSFYRGQFYSHTSDTEMYIKDPIPKLPENSGNPMNYISDFVITAFRLTKGFSLNDFKNRFSVDFYDLYGDTVNIFLRDSFLERDDESIRVTEKGLLVLDTLLTEFM